MSSVVVPCGSGGVADSTRNGLLLAGGVCGGGLRWQDFEDGLFDHDRLTIKGETGLHVGLLNGCGNVLVHVAEFCWFGLNG